MKLKCHSALLKDAERSNRELWYNTLRVLGCSWTFFITSILKGSQNSPFIWNRKHWNGYLIWWTPLTELAGWQLRWSEFGFDVVHRTGILNVSNPLWRLETNGMPTTELNGNLLEMIVTFLQHREGKIDHDPDASSDWSTIFQLGEDIVGTEISALPEELPLPTLLPRI